MKLRRIAETVLCTALLAALAVPASAASYVAKAPDGALPAGTLIYYEDFEGITANDTESTLKAINWSKSENFREFTAEMSIVDGCLHTDNLDATVGGSNDSYAWVLDNDYCAEFVKHPYTYQYDATLLDAENDYRYLSVLLNYDGMNNYNTVDVRMRGIGYNQYREGDGTWVHYDEMMSYTDDTAICKVLYDIDYEEGQYAMQNKTFTIKVEVDPEKGCNVYVNNILFSQMNQNTEHWADQCAYGNAIAFKTSTKLLSNFDNFMIWAGTGVQPDLSVLNPVVEETPADDAVIADAPAAEDNTAAPAPTSPKTADAGVVGAAAVLALAAAVVLKKKH